MPFPLRLKAISIIVFGLLTLAPHTVGAEERLVPQFGNASTPSGILWAPDGRWFATATAGDIVLWDAATGDVLRALRPPDAPTFAYAVASGAVAAFAIAGDGATVAARAESGRVFAWDAATGAVRANAVEALMDARWLDITPREGAALFGAEAEKFWKDNKLQALLAPTAGAVGSGGLVYNVREGQATVAFSLGSGDAARGGVALIDTTRHSLVARWESAPEEEIPGLECGQPWAGFARHGDRVALAPTATDASHHFANAAVFDISTEPPRLMWQFQCRNFMFSSISIAGGRIRACPNPVACEVWNPHTAKIESKLDKAPERATASVSPDGKYRRVAREGRGFEIVETATGKTIFTSDRDIAFDLDGRCVWTLGAWQDQSVDYWSLATGQKLWTATEVFSLAHSYGQAAADSGSPFLIVEYPDGKFRLSKGAEKLVRIVDGFHARALTPADRAKFLKP